MLIEQSEFVRRRVVRALEKRSRYRYVEPLVTATPGGYMISSPCCSRNVDPDGGVIKIARIECFDGNWLLFSHDHENAEWVLYAAYDSLDALFVVVCADSERLFWP